MNLQKYGKVHKKGFKKLKMRNSKIKYQICMYSKTNKI